MADAGPDPRCRVARASWRMGATVLVWPTGADTPPFLAEIDGQWWDGRFLVAHLRTERGSGWAIAPAISSARDALRAAAMNQPFRIGQC